MLRRLRLEICLLIALPWFHAGCGDEGRYELSWRFEGDDVRASAAQCGARGVESFWVDERSDEGEQRRVRVLCGFGFVERTVAPGTWTVALTGLDARGQGPGEGEGMALRGQAGPFAVAGDADPVRLEVVVTPRPVCSDGVDNDGDGRVDGDDPGCPAAAREDADP